MSHTCYVFDAYGTLFDVHSAVARHAREVGENAARVSEIWRNKQLEYSWTRSGMGKYRDFWTLTEEALDFALASVPGANKDARKALLDAYMELDCYPEVPGVLKALKESGARTAILSNGSPDMLNSAVKSASLGDVLDEVFSIHPLMVFKTSPETYRMVTDYWKIERERVSFQSSNRWDIAGAAAFGFDCAWINRTGQPDEYGDLPPSRVLKDLKGLLVT
ncbi:MAG: haloacid dehalogenase type II [Sphingomonadaceae bacterium]|nr:haloacid dehalogenase type II [Sphingomonadaceae bacterium]